MEDREYALMDAAEDGMWWYRALHARLIAQLAPVRGVVLDAGCGTGGLLAALARGRPDLALRGVEYRPQVATRAADKSGAAICVGSINALPFRDASFDAVVSADVLCHAAVDPGTALGELLRVLAPGGLLVLNMPSYAWLASAHDRRVHNARRVTAGGLTRMLQQAGFTHVRSRYWNGLLLPLMIAQRKLLSRGEARSDVAAFSPWLDTMLHAATRAEAALPFPLPAGGSVIATALRPPLEPRA